MNGGEGEVGVSLSLVFSVFDESRLRLFVFLPFFCSFVFCCFGVGGCVWDGGLSVFPTFCFLRCWIVVVLFFWICRVVVGDVGFRFVDSKIFSMLYFCLLGREFSCVVD